MGSGIFFSFFPVFFFLFFLFLMFVFEDGRNNDMFKDDQDWYSREGNLMMKKREGRMKKRCLCSDFRAEIKRRNWRSLGTQFIYRQQE